MSSNNGTKYMENKYSKSHHNKLDKFKQNCQDGIVTLPERQFNCPSCINFESSSCQIPSWVKYPREDIKCFNCPPKYLYFDESSYHFVTKHQ
ncbi:unnamed protein product [Rotaria socialis]|uniref:Uncharacterized protein n=1 Tax=Rotaria socialis TaxID=392032 RepID=A0A817VTG6_9BILA|nr:unnamed protein product [Rotaria socialis]CAF4579163.1 unnamed protein product [Rotaria socialis]